MFRARTIGIALIGIALTAPLHDASRRLHSITHGGVLDERIATISSVDVTYGISTNVPEIP